MQIYQNLEVWTIGENKYVTFLVRQCPRVVQLHFSHRHVMFSSENQDLHLKQESKSDIACNIDKTYHWVRKEWPKKKNRHLEEITINNLSVERQKIFLCPFHIKMDFIKQSVQNTDKNVTIAYIKNQSRNIRRSTNKTIH